MCVRPCWLLLAHAKEAVAYPPGHQATARRCSSLRSRRHSGLHTSASGRFRIGLPQTTQGRSGSGWAARYSARLLAFKLPM
jgi:hypothetical protein